MTKEYWQLILMIIVAILGPAGAAYIGVKVIDWSKKQNKMAKT